jgi:hypothetical protein
LSRPRSGRGASALAGRPGVFVQTPKSDIYVVMLGIVLGAMIIGCLLMVLILSRYEFKIKVSALTLPSLSALAAFSGKISPVHL